MRTIDDIRNEWVDVAGQEAEWFGFPRIAAELKVLLLLTPGPMSLGEMAQRLEGVVCKLQAKVSEEDRLYGSITVRDIIMALAKEGVDVEKRMILLTEPIKTIGLHKVPIRVYKEVEPEITVEVLPE